MKKILLYMSIIIFLFFAIPIFCTFGFKKIESKEDTEDSDKEDDNTVFTLSDAVEVDSSIDTSSDDYSYGEYATIKLLHSDTGDIEEIDLDEYLCNVVSAEMPVDYEEEALKAQAVVARTYTLYKIINGSKHKNEGADICDDSTCCQAWISKDDRYSKWLENQDEKWQKIQNAVTSTAGKIITYNGEVINAFFHSNSGGLTESPAYVWGGTNYPYLQSVETSGEDEYSQYSSEVILSKTEFVEKMKEEYSDFKIDFGDENCIKIKSYTEGGRVKSIVIGNKTLTGVETRKIFSLKSANFEVEIGSTNIKFTVIGYGHGVGMSQTGSDTLAKEGKSYIEIIKHYYTGVEVVNSNY